jgi:hypothetical protein
MVPEHQDQKTITMKAKNIPKTLLLGTALVFFAATARGQDQAADPVAGTWTKSVEGRTIHFTMSPDNTFQVKFTGGEDPDVWGSWKVSGTLLTVTDEGGEYGSNSSAQYEFEVGEDSLTLTVKFDPVDGRRELMRGTWNRVPDAGK